MNFETNPCFKIIKVSKGASAYTGFTNKILNHTIREHAKNHTGGGGLQLTHTFKRRVYPMLKGGVTAHKVLSRYPGKYGELFGQFHTTYRTEMTDIAIGAPKFQVDKRYINYYSRQMKMLKHKNAAKLNQTLSMQKQKQAQKTNLTLIRQNQTLSKQNQTLSKQNQKQAQKTKLFV